MVRRILAQEVNHYDIPDLRGMADLPGAPNRFRKLTEAQMQAIMEEGFAWVSRQQHLAARLDRGEIDGEQFSSEMEEIEQRVEATMHTIFTPAQEQEFILDMQAWPGAMLERYREDPNSFPELVLQLLQPSEASR